MNIPLFSPVVLTIYINILYVILIYVQIELEGKIYHHILIHAENIILKLLLINLPFSLITLTISSFVFTFFIISDIFTLIFCSLLLSSSIKTELEIISIVFIAFLLLLFMTIISFILSNKIILLFIPYIEFKSNYCHFFILSFI